MFCEYFKSKEHPKHINQQEIKEFLVWVNHKYSVCQERQCFWALRFWYLEIEKQIHKMDGIKPPKWKKRIQIPLDKDFILGTIRTVRDKKHKAIISLLYATGLRRSEAAHLKLKDIDSKNMIITVRQGKGGKDRIVQLPETLLQILRDYIVDAKKKNQEPVEWLFESSKGRYISPSTINRVVNQYLHTNTHRLRHSFASELYYNGTDILSIRDELGHTGLKTTELYVHNDPRRLQEIQNPLDDLNKPNNLRLIKPNRAA
jgi:site-specific recombinase XerD